MCGAATAGALVHVCRATQPRLLAWLATVPFVLCMRQFITGVHCIQLSDLTHFWAVRQSGIKGERIVVIVNKAGRRCCA